MIERLVVEDKEEGNKAPQEHFNSLAVSAVDLALCLI